MLTFQDLLSKLTSFWAEKGCIIHQGHDIEVGAGTFNPATFLRSLGPEPYSTAYIEPSRRPQDARYAENPNRVHLFHQFQVIIKPSPLDIQQTYLQSLEHIGFDLSLHDIRFVHDDWESPSLGAWGLGWEVWMDGMEITQYTYFQSVGSQPLNPIPVEITYGLERLAMYIQDVDSIFDIHWNDQLTFGDIVAQGEWQWSHYNFTYANTKMWENHFKDFEAEAKVLIENDLPFPAYDFVMKASHAFNILEAKRAISVSERVRYIAKIRELARLCAESYLSSRQKINYPLLDAKEKKSVKNPENSPSLEKYNPDAQKDFLLEIGSEELPASFVLTGLQSLENEIKKFLKSFGLSYKNIQTFATQRRLCLLVTELQEGTCDQIIEKKGPPLSTAFDAHGHLTRQGMGFFQSLNLSPVSLEELEKKAVDFLSIEEVKGTRYLFVKRLEKGHSTATLLSNYLPQLIEKIHFPKKMHWSDLSLSYARPLKWILALFGKEIIPCQLGPITSDRKTYGHSQLDKKEISIKKIEDYKDLLKKHYVLIDIAERKAVIEDQLQQLEKKYEARSVEKKAVLDEVLFLSEYPQLVIGEFNQEFLTAPKEVLISEMVTHQRYFPLLSTSGYLLPYFVIIADNTPNELMIKGNQKVLSARLADGVFLYKEDLQKPLENYLDLLKSMTFQKDLGSVFDKAQRLVKHARHLSSILGFANLERLQRAALLSKADLATRLVHEFPNLQGIIGAHYALQSQEHPDVATAISEHYLPRFEADILPKTKMGLICSLADKLDNILGYFSVGIRPTSSSDPYALRRQTLGVIKMLLESQKHIDLKKLYVDLLSHFPSSSNSKAFFHDLENFTLARMKTIFEEFGFKKDEIDACLSHCILDPYDLSLRLKALSNFRQTPQFSALYEVFKRAKGQLHKTPSYEIEKNLLREKSEKNLFDHIQSSEKELRQILEQRNYEKAMHILISFYEPLAHLYDEVKILSDEEHIRHNRLALLQKVFSCFHLLLDFSKLQEHNNKKSL